MLQICGNIEPRLRYFTVVLRRSRDALATAPCAAERQQADVAARWMRTLGSHHLIGSPETIAKELMRLNEMGIDAVT